MKATVVKSVFAGLALALHLVGCACDEYDNEPDLRSESTDAVAPSCVFYVDTEADPDGDGLSWESALRVVEDAVRSARAQRIQNEEDCEVWIKEGAPLPEDFDFAGADGQFRGVKLRGGMHGDETLDEYSLISRETKGSHFGFSNDINSRRVNIGNFTFDNNYSGDFSPIAPPEAPEAIFDSAVALGDIPGFVRIHGSGPYLSIDNTSSDFRYVWGVGTSEDLTLGWVDYDGIPTTAYLMYYDRSSNKFGFHTQWPGSTLHIDGPSDSSGTSGVLQLTDNSSSQHMVFDANEIDTVNSPLYLNYNNMNDIRIGYNDDYASRVFLARGEYAKVLIGTTDADDSDSPQLLVDGLIKCEELIVDNVLNADFVFEDNYLLRPLEKVEEFIEHHGHLPDIPSAMEMTANGSNIGEMQGRLLQKIEELTLYVIRQNKEIEQLKRAIAQGEE